MAKQKVDVLEKRWTKEANDLLKGLAVKLVRYMSKEEAEDLGWYSRSIVLEMHDGTLLYCSADDEGNDAGALFYQTKDKEGGVIPVF